MERSILGAIFGGLVGISALGVMVVGGMGGNSPAKAPGGEGAGNAAVQSDPGVPPRRLPNPPKPEPNPT